MKKLIDITGPDDDGLVWVHFNGTTLHGAISSHKDRLTGKAMLEVRDQLEKEQANV